MAVPALFSKQSPGMPNGGYGQYQPKQTTSPYSRRGKAMRRQAVQQALKGANNGK